MEMGSNALVAAAFHFCKCIDARERSVRSRSQTSSRLGRTSSAADDVDSLSHWEFRLPPLEIESFGYHAAQIERDAARLKRLEVVASMVVHNSNTNRSNNKNNRELLESSSPDVAKKAADNSAISIRPRRRIGVPWRSVEPHAYIDCVESSKNSTVNKRRDHRHHHHHHHRCC